MKSVQREPNCSILTDGQTVTKKLIVAFRNFPNAPKISLEVVTFEFKTCRRHTLNSRLTLWIVNTQGTVVVGGTLLRRQVQNIKWRYKGSVHFVTNFIHSLARQRLCYCCPKLTATNTSPVTSSCWHTVGPFWLQMASVARIIFRSKNTAVLLWGDAVQLPAVTLRCPWRGIYFFLLKKVTST